MAKKNICIICNKKSAKRFCLIKKQEICPICCAKTRNESECNKCKHFDISKEYVDKKTTKETSRLGSVFGSPQMQKSIMEASIDLMDNHATIGDKFDKDPDYYSNESFTFFNTPEFEDFSFAIEEIEHIFVKIGKPEQMDAGWFYTEEGQKYYSEAVALIVNEVRFKTFSQKLFKILLNYYYQKDIEKAWLILSTVNRLMENDFVVPFTILMFFRGMALWKKINL